MCGFKKHFPLGSQIRKTKLRVSRLYAMFTKEADVTTEAGFLLAFNIAKAKKPYTEEEFTKKNMAQVVSILAPENKEL